MFEAADDLSKSPTHECYGGARLACFECFRAEREHRHAPQTPAETPAAGQLLRARRQPLTQRTGDHRRRMLAYLQSCEPHGNGRLAPSGVQSTN